MKIHKYIIIILLSVLFPFFAFTQGLKIQGNNFFIDNRTCYTVFDQVQPVFKDKLVLDFEIALQDLSGAFATGYILRIKNEEENTTYNILYKDQGNTAVFNFNHEGKDVLISAEINKDQLYIHPWMNFQISFDIRKDSLMLKINNDCFYAGGLALKTEWKPDIYFGRSEYVIDIPTYSLRNLTISGDEKKYSFPLNESSGEEVHDSRKKVIGHVLNPDWLINDASFWDFKTSFRSQSVAGSTFNPETQEIYYTNKDSIIFYNVRTSQTTSKKYVNKCPMTFRLGTNFVDNEKKRLYFYDVATPPSGDVTIAYLDLEELRWSAVSTEILPTQLHHHGSFFDKINRRYIIFGGFGNVCYSKEFFSYDLDENKWSTLTFEGDKITPRYFLSMGYQENENSLYLFGGMGNESGDQSVGRVYYYDLYKIDLNKNEIKKLWEIKKPSVENIVPVRGMVIADDSTFYTLCYPEHFSKSSLKLYHFSLRDGSYEILADSIPVISEKITTHGNLYYNTNTNKLYSIVQQFEKDDIASLAKVYSISFPPVTADELTIYSKIEKSPWQLLLKIFPAIVALFAVAYIWIRVRRNRKKKNIALLSEENVVIENRLSADKQAQECRANAIYLFGDFSVIDRQNREINYMLSVKLKQAFFLIMQYSLDKGIASPEFSELLWPDKPEDKVKNSRGVILNNLRKILGDLDGIKLIYEKGFFRIVITEACYCDYWRCMEIISGDQMEQHTDELISIISRGKFLRSVDIPVLDSFKELIERKVEPVLYVGMERSFSSGNYPMVIQLCEGIFDIDPLSEGALWHMVHSFIKLKMIDEARKKYYLFAIEYRKAMGEEYPKTFSELAD